MKDIIMLSFEVTQFDVDDLGFPIYNHGNIKPWMEKGFELISFITCAIPYGEKFRLFITYRLEK